MRSRKLLSYFFVAFTIFLANCDTTGNTPSPDINYFLKFYGDDGFQTGVDMVVAPDGSVIMLGNVRTAISDISPQPFLIKVDPSGTVLHQASLTFVNGAEAKDLEISKDGQKLIVLANYIQSSTVHNVMVLRYDLNLNLLDSARVSIIPKDASGVVSKQNVEGNSISETLDGYIIAGVAAPNLSGSSGGHTTDALQLRIKNDLSPGPSYFTKVIGYGNINSAARIIQTDSDSYYLFGYSDGQDSGKVSPTVHLWSVKVDHKGSPVYDIKNGPATANVRCGSAVKSTTQDKYFVAGIASPTKTPTSSVIYALALIPNTSSPLFSTSFEKELGFELKTPGTSVIDVSPSSSGGAFLLTNEMTVGTDNNNIFLIKINELGETDWTAPLVYGGVGQDYAGSITELPNGKLLICGTMSQNGQTKMVLIKVNKDGKFAE